MKKLENQTLVNEIKSHVPELTTQAQFDILSVILDGVLVATKSACTLDRPGFDQAKDAINKMLDLLYKASAFKVQVEDEPEAVSNQSYTAPPAEFSEESFVDGELAKLTNLATRAEFDAWYEAIKPQRDRLTSTALRNRLLDAARARLRQL